MSMDDYFRGYARVALDYLHFGSGIASQKHRAVDKNNVQRLVDLFSSIGCDKTSEEHAVIGTIPEDRLQHALIDLGIASLPERLGAAEAPLLRNIPIDCLQGLHRVEAAKKIFDGSDRWWTVKLYSSELPSSLANKITVSYKNEKQEADGQIVRNILLKQYASEDGEDGTWWTRLSRSKAKELKQVLKSRVLSNALHELKDIPGLWCWQDMGSLHRLLTLRCDEPLYMPGCFSIHHPICVRVSPADEDQEVGSALRHVLRVWNEQILGGINGAIKEHIDGTTVSHIEGLAPGASEEDRRLVVDMMLEGRIFPALTDENTRKQLLDNLTRLPCLVPSLHTVFEALKQLEPACSAMKLLIGTGPQGTIHKRLMASYQHGALGVVERGKGRLAAAKWKTAEERRWFGYVQLWVFCLRNFPFLSNMTPRKERDERKPAMRQPNEALLHQLGRLAVESGFRTRQALHWSGLDPMAALSHRFREEFEIAVGRSHGDLEMELRQLLSCSLSAKTEQQRPPRFFQNVKLETKRRLGRPFETEFAVDRNELYIETLLCRPERKEQEPYIGLAFVRRDLLSCLFDRHELKLSDLAPEEVSIEFLGVATKMGARADADTMDGVTTELTGREEMDTATATSSKAAKGQDASCDQADAGEQSEDDDVLESERENAMHRGSLAADNLAELELELTRKNTEIASLRAELHRLDTSVGQNDGMVDVGAGTEASSVADVVAKTAETQGQQLERSLQAELSELLSVLSGRQVQKPQGPLPPDVDVIVEVMYGRRSSYRIPRTLVHLVMQEYAQKGPREEFRLKIENGCVGPLDEQALIAHVQAARFIEFERCRKRRLSAPASHSEENQGLLRDHLRSMGSAVEESGKAEMEEQEAKRRNVGAGGRSRPERAGRGRDEENTGLEIGMNMQWKEGAAAAEEEEEEEEL